MAAELYEDDECTKAADLKILECGKHVDEQMASVLLRLRPLGLRLDVLSLLSNSTENRGVETNFEDFSSSLTSEKLKASNFEATLVRIGKWERRKINEGNIIVKCYFAKKRLVWEFLEGKLKSKIEIQWNEIIGIRADLQENKPGILEIELNNAPEFFRETDPQPRRHTVWKPTSDFTGNEASTFRRHYVVFSSGSLDKHYEKLLQCDQRLYELSRKPFPSLRTQYFEQHFQYLNFSSHYQTDVSTIGRGLQFDFSCIPSTIMAPHPITSFNEVSPVSVMDSSGLDEPISSYNVLDPTLQTSPLPYLPSYTNDNQFSCQANKDPNMVAYMITNLEEELFTEDQVTTYDEKYHMERVASLNAIVNPLQDIDEQGLQLGQQFGTENGFVFNEHTFDEHHFMVSKNGSTFKQCGSENYHQRVVYSQPIHPQDPVIQQAWDILSDPSAGNCCQDIDLDQVNRWRLNGNQR